MADKTDTIKTRIQFEGEKEYKENCAQIINHLKVLSSELKASLLQFIRNGEGVQALCSKQDTLNKSFDEQKNKISQAEKSLKALSNAQEKNSGTAKNMETALSVVNTGMLSTSSHTKDLDEKLQKTTKSSSTFGEKLKGVLTVLGGGIAKGAKVAGESLEQMGKASIAAAAGAGKMVMSSASNANELQRLSNTTGLTAEQIQIMKYQSASLGVEFGTMAGAQAGLAQAMSGAKDGTGTAGKAFKALGVAVMDSNGNLRNGNDVFNEAISKLGGVQNSAERNALAMQLFGKSAAEISPLIKAGGDGLKNMSDQAKANGMVMSNEAVSGLDNFQNSLNASQLALKGMAGTMIAGTLPILNQFTGLIVNLSGALNTALLSGDFSQFGTVLSTGITALVTQISAMMIQAIPIVSQALSSAIMAISQAIPVVLPVLMDGVVLMITSVLQILQDNGPAFLNAGMQAIMILISGLTTALPQIMTTAITLISTLVNSLSAQLPTLIPIAVQAILTIVDGLLNNLPQIINSAIQIIAALIVGLANALPQLLEQVPIIILTIINGIVGALPQLMAAAPKIIVSIIMGIINALPQLIAEVPKVLEAIIVGLNGALPMLLFLGPQMLTEIWNGLRAQDWWKIGSDIMKGICDGFGKAAQWVSEGVKGAGQALQNGFKTFFGIHSPSALMRDEVGKYIGLGISEGIQATDFMAGVPSMVAKAKAQINGAMFGMAANVNLNDTKQNQVQRSTQGLIVNIEHFHNDRQQTTQAFAQELEFYVRNAAAARG